MSTTPPRIFTLSNARGLEIRLMDQGATWLSCLVPLADGSRREVLLGCRTPEDYLVQKSFLGATIGRYANRIAGSRFSLDGQEHSLTPSQGKHCLHGGPDGFDRRRWSVGEITADSITFTLDSPAGDQGFPGQARVSALYRLEEDSVTLEYRAEVDAPCPLSLTNHAYFNLDGDGDVLGHSLRLAASRYLPVDADLIPLAAPAPVTGTSFDFLKAQTIGSRLLADEQQKIARGYDHSFLLDEGSRTGCEAAAEVRSADTRLSMRLFTDHPALQFYSGNYLDGTPARDGSYGRYAGLALEPGFPPDAPNRAAAEACILRPGTVYRHFIRFQFLAE
ncbi:galactose-1-epimerase [Niveibacterium terrae]|uniref:galactose-1-epimerase n=1 Tax=Niveibacterium terrae TaxID=3373598 RepID=UPI003A8E1790